MAMSYYSANIDNDQSIIISPLTNLQANAAGINPDNAGGYYLYYKSQSSPEDVEVLARVQSEEAAFRLSRLLKLV